MPARAHSEFRTKSSQSPGSASGRRLNALIALTCLVLAIGLPALTLYGLCTTPAEAWLARQGGRALSTAAGPGVPVAMWQAALAAFVAMLPVLAMAYGLLRARLCFLGFGRGETFSLATVRHLRGFAAGIVASALAGLLSPTLIGLLLTLGAAPGKRMLTLGVGSNDVLLLLFAGIVWQVAHVMTQAVALADEHAQIV